MIIINKAFCLLVGLVLLFSHPVFGNELVIDKNNFAEVDLTGHIATLVDTHAVWTWDQLPKDDKLWGKLKENVLSGGLTGYAYWYKIELENLAANQYLRLGDPLIDEIDVYFVNDSGLIRHSRSGSSLAFEKREVKVPDYYFILPQGSCTSYIRLKKNVNFQCPLSIASIKYFTEKEHKNNLVLGLYFGIFFVLIFYNLFIYFFIKEKSYLYYIFYLWTTIVLFVGSLKGVFFQYLWSNTPYFNLFIPSCSAMALVAMALFAMSLLQTKIHLPKYTKGFYVFIGIAILDIIINLFSPIISTGIIEFTGLIFAAYLTLTGIQSHRKGVQVAKFFLWAWGFNMLCVIIYVVQLNVVIVSNIFTRNAIFYGSAFEAILFSLLLAYRVKILRIEKEEAERREFQEREDKLLYLREQAHEIRNPVQFSSNYISTIKRNIGYINDLIIQYQGLEEVNFKKKQKQIKQFEDTIEIELVKQELTEGVNLVELAFSRIKDIANNFDLGAELYCSIDVNKCIRDTLLMIRKDLGEHIDIREELGEIPEIRSFTGKLGQVFTNIIKNAIEAIKEKKLLKNEFLFVKTSLQSEKLIIRIKDTGVGMTEQTKEKAFNKFYTTKAEGNGTV